MNNGATLVFVSSLHLLIYLSEHHHHLSSAMKKKRQKHLAIFCNGIYLFILLYATFLDFNRIVIRRNCAEFDVIRGISR